jgi:NitT/TauT family transport system substrate-binding protein
MKKVLALLLAATLCLGLLAGCGQTETTEEDTTAAETTDTTEAADTAETTEAIVITEQVRGYHWAPAYLAESLGYFEEAGLDVEFQTVQGMDATAPLFSGDAQFALKGVESALMVNEEGQGCKIVASTTKKYPYNLMGASEEYSTLESLTGGTVVGGQSANSGPYSFALACLNQAGLTPDQDVTVTTMASSGYAAAIESGEIQAAVSTNPWSAKKLADLGAVTIVEGTDDAVITDLIGSDTYELFCVIASDDYIASNPETVQKVVTAIAKAMQWMETASAEDIANALSPLFEGADEELLYDAQYDQEHGLANFTGYHTESGFQAALNLTKLAGGISTDLTEEQIYDESFLDQAWAELG